MYLYLGHLLAVWWGSPGSAILVSCCMLCLGDFESEIGDTRSEDSGEGEHSNSDGNRAGSA